MRASVCSRRIRSIARLRAVATIQAPGFAGVPCARPALGGDDERILNRVLGEIEIAEDAAENCDAARTLISIGAGERVYSRYSEFSRTGRISIVPLRAAGIRSARAIASSSESASIRQYAAQLLARLRERPVLDDGVAVPNPHGRRRRVPDVVLAVDEQQVPHAQRTTTGRTSTVPPIRADGMRAAICSASSEESASMR